MNLIQAFLLISLATFINIIWPSKDFVFSPNDNIDDNVSDIKILDSSDYQNIIPLGFSNDSKYLLCIKTDIKSCYIDDISKVQFIVYQLSNDVKTTRQIYHSSNLKNINGVFLISVKNKNSVDLYSIKINNGEIVQYDFLPFNTNANEIQGSFTYDKQKIYFSSDRAGGYGGYDIYEVEYIESGKWSMPRNLGPNVNTAADEISPFIMSDGLTLFFSRNFSDNRNDFDIFYTTIMDDGSIDVVENLGDSINSHRDDVCIHVNYNNYNAIFVSKNLNSCYLNEFNL
ncbi:MAG: hypothetical protein QMD02_04280 [Bacteroidales bacterium]|nr:hypothetical protein [Bacteroidales bacterium]